MEGHRRYDLAREGMEDLPVVGEGGQDFLWVFVVVECDGSRFPTHGQYAKVIYSKLSSLHRVADQYCALTNPYSYFLAET